MIFLIASIIIFYAICFIVPRRLTWIEILVVTWFGQYFETMTNVFLDLKYDLYGYSNHGVDWLALLPLIGIYPPLNYLVLSLFPAGKGVVRIVIYLLAWDAFAILYEQLAIHNKIFYYNGWKWWYSAIVYPFIFLALWYHLKLTKWIISKSFARM